MTKPEIEELLCDVASWRAEEQDVKTAFATEMIGRRYGGEALVDAWLWFAAGFRCAAGAPSRD